MLREKMLLVHGRAFNIEDTQHFRLVFLPDTGTLSDALDRFERFITHYDQKDL